jgi:hypothetical protein
LVLVISFQEIHLLEGFLVSLDHRKLANILWILVITVLGISKIVKECIGIDESTCLIRISLPPLDINFAFQPDNLSCII